MKKGFKYLGLSILFGLLFVGTSIAQEAMSLEDAIKGGKVSGTVGNYFEYKDVNVGTNAGWSTTYLTLKYETAAWNGLKAGARFFAHGDSYNEAEGSTADPFNVDIEKEFTLPELYLTYMFLENSNVTAGRFNHQKISHFDDAQSEGGFVQYNEIENVELTAGFMTQFAEIDYDDGEDFGRTNDSQDLSNEGTYGSGSKGYVMFIEKKYTGIENITLNPYAYYQDGYAGVYGLDAKLSLEADDIKYGVSADVYYVHSDKTATENATNWLISPFVKVGMFDLTAGYAQYGDKATAMYKPEWFADYFIPMDQLNVTVGPKYDQKIYFVKAKMTIDKFWAHIAFSEADYSIGAVTNAAVRENEFQVGYNVTKNLALNARIFKVEFDNDAADYDKVETSVTFKF